MERTRGVANHKNQVTVDDWSTGAKPIFSAFSASVSSGWTQVGVTDVWYRTLSGATVCAWLRDTADPLGEANGPYAKAANSSLTALQWYHDTGANTLYVNCGVGVSPNTKTLEWVIENAVSGVTMSGDLGRVQNIRCDGFGIRPSSYQSQKCGIQSTSTGSNANLFVNCESFFGSSHLLQHYNGGSSGGVATFIGCVCGWMCPTCAANFTNLDALNDYASTGAQEAIFHGCSVLYGTLPDSANGLQAASSVTMGQNARFG